VIYIALKIIFGVAVFALMGFLQVVRYKALKQLAAQAVVVRKNEAKRRLHEMASAVADEIEIRRGVVAPQDEVMESLAERKAAIQPMLDYLQKN